MVFVQDEEVFPVVNPDDFPQVLAVNVDDVPEKETTDAVGQTDNARKNGKRKSPETDDKKPLEKKDRDYDTDRGRGRDRDKERDRDRHRLRDNNDYALWLFRTF